MLPAIPPLVVPFKVITSLLAPDIKVLPAASLLPKYKPPTNLSVPSVLMSKSVAAVSITKVNEAPKLLVWLGSSLLPGAVATMLGT